MTRLDDKIRAAFQALEATVESRMPDGYFDDFASRVDARLEEQAMNGTEMSDVNGDKDRDIPAIAATKDEKAETWEDDEHSGVAEIQELASLAKKRVSHRATTQTEAEESLLHSASQSGLSSIVLPSPGKDTPSFAEETEKPAGKGIGKKAKAASAVGLATDESRGGLPVWIYGAVGVVAVAAVVFFVIRGGGGDKKDKVTKNQGIDKRVGSTATGDQPPPPATSPTAPTKTADAPSAVALDKSDDSSKNADPAAPPSTVGSGGATADGVDGAKVATNAPVAKKAVVRRNVAAKTTNRMRTKNAKTTPRKVPKTTKAPTRRRVKKGGKQSVEDLLGQFDEKKGKKAVKVAPKVIEKKTLSRIEIKQGMRAISSRVQGCYNLHKQSGLVMIQVSINGKGGVGARPTGKFAGTKTGACVAAAVRLARFPKFSGAPMSFPYPFRLNP